MRRWRNRNYLAPWESLTSAITCNPTPPCTKAYLCTIVVNGDLSMRSIQRFQMILSSMRWPSRALFSNYFICSKILTCRRSWLIWTSADYRAWRLSASSPGTFLRRSVSFWLVVKRDFRERKARCDIVRISWRSILQIFKSPRMQSSTMKFSKSLRQTRMRGRKTHSSTPSVNWKCPRNRLRLLI